MFDYGDLLNQLARNRTGDNEGGYNEQAPPVSEAEWNKLDPQQQMQILAQQGGNTGNLYSAGGQTYSSNPIIGPRVYDPSAISQHDGVYSSPTSNLNNNWGSRFNYGMMAVPILGALGGAMMAGEAGAGAAGMDAGEAALAGTQIPPGAAIGGGQLSGSGALGSADAASGLFPHVSDAIGGSASMPNTLPGGGLFSNWAQFANDPWGTFTSELRANPMGAARAGLGLFSMLGNAGGGGSGGGSPGGDYFTGPIPSFNPWLQQISQQQFHPRYSQRGPFMSGG